MQLQSMYQEIILDHYRNPHGRGLREPYEAEVHHVNPTCGKTVPEALETGEHFMTLMQSKGDASVAEKLEDELEDAVAFAGVSKYPARIKCALMSWMALKDASARAWGGQS
jgi:nitrogen fixation NifU-like protein